MPAVQVVECQTAAEVRERLRAHAERRRRLSGPIPATPAIKLSFPEPQPIEEDALTKETQQMIDAAVAMVRSVSTTRVRPTIRAIMQHTALVYGIHLNEILSRRRDKEVCQARQVAMLLAKLLTSQSFPYIGRYFGDRDHTTVMHAFKKLKWLSDALSPPLTDNDPVETWAARAAELYPPFRVQR
jgi:hypothetical protein